MQTLIKALFFTAACVLLTGFFYMLSIVATGQMLAGAQCCPSDPVDTSSLAEDAEESGSDSASANPYESCQSPRQRAYMLEHQRRLDEDARK